MLLLCQCVGHACSVQMVCPSMRWMDVMNGHVKMVFLSPYNFSIIITDTCVYLC
jgi:hypothetical protein